MGTVTIWCSTTNEALSTGMTMEAAAFDEATLTDETVVVCPLCAGVHVWSKGDAHLSDD